jgi:signal peptidase I
MSRELLEYLEEKSLSKRDIVQSGIFIVVIAVLLFVMRQFVFTPVIVKGHSMDPTLEDQERVIALKHAKIDRFDIVTFPAPDEPNKNYIKRVIGLPGDDIKYMDDVLYINGKAYEEPYLDDYKRELTDGEPLTSDFTLKKLFGSERVPKGKLFVMGDNRRISKDSRIIGYVDEKKVLGVVKFAFWPLKDFGVIHNNVDPEKQK